MSEQLDKESKTEEATEHRLRTAIEKGNIAQSRELANFSTIFGSLVGMAILTIGILPTFVGFLAFWLDHVGDISLEHRGEMLLRTVTWNSLLVVLPFAVTIALFGFISGASQNTPQLVTERLRPQLSRISPMAGFKRIFGQQGLVEFLKSVAKLAFVSWIGYRFIFDNEIYVLSALRADPTSLPNTIFVFAQKLILTFCAVGVLFSVTDWAWVRFHWKRGLRMTRREVKDELKQFDGDPAVKARQRSLARSRSRQRMLAKVPTATLVIANPTHFAVALRYVRSEGGAPRVVAKGQDLIALKIREIAEQNQIPVVEDKPLARSLYDSTKVDAIIPPEFYRAVAKIILFLGSRKSHNFN